MLKLLIIVLMILIVLSPVVVAQETTTTTPTTTPINQINITLPSISPFTPSRLDVAIYVYSFNTIMISLVGQFSTNPEDELYPINIRVYNNETQEIVASVYYNPSNTCFDVNKPIQGNNNIYNGTMGIHYGRWIITSEATVLKIEIYRVYNCSCPATCFGDEITTYVMEECDYVLLNQLVVELPKGFPVPEEYSSLFSSLYLAFMLGILVAFMLRGDIRTIGVGMVLVGGIMVPFMYALNVYIENAPLVSVLLVISGLIVLWLNK